ncbi:MAG TPA: hypothetical protein VF134_01410 [Candidatus Dormibacteraeota bacterium]
MRKVIQRSIRATKRGVDVAVDVNAAMATSTGEQKAARAESVSYSPIVQDSRRPKRRVANDVSDSL